MSGWSTVSIRRGWVIRWVLVPLLAGTLLATVVDPGSPAFFATDRISAVLLLDGQAYFGQLRDDPLSDSVELRGVYYFQDARSTTTNLPLGLVRRGGEVHQPADGMIIRRDKILAIERAGRGSQVTTAIATDRAIQASASR